MTDKLRTILYIALGVIVLALAVYFIFFYKATLSVNPEPQSAQVEIAGYSDIGPKEYKLMPGEYTLKISLPDYITYEKKIKLKMNQKVNLDIKLKSQPDAIKVADFPAKFTTLTEDKKSLIYISNQGKTAYIVYNADSQEKSEPTAITPEVFSEVEQMIWHPGKRLAITKKNNQHTGLYDFGRYDLLNQESKDWGKGIGDVAFDSVGDKIIYFYAPDTGEKSIIRANKDNTGIERLFDLREYNLTNPKVRWSADSKYVLFVTDQIFIFDVYHKTLAQLTQFSSISDAIFTPDSQNIIYEQTDKLFSADLAGENQKDLGINSSLKKTTWLDDKTLLYAYREENKMADTVSAILIDNLQIKNFEYKQNQPINILYPIVAKDNKKIFFESNGYDYSLELVDREYD